MENDLEKIEKENWDTPDPKNPDFSLTEWDVFYSRPITSSPEESFRESIRKNLKTGMWEVYRHHFHPPNSWKLEPWDEVIYVSSDPKDAWNYAMRDMKRYYGERENREDATSAFSHCRRCGRPLRNKKSIERGYGSKCWEIIQSGGR